MDINEFKPYRDEVRKTDYEKVLDDFAAMRERCVARRYGDKVEQRRDLDMFRYYINSTPQRRMRYRHIQVSQRGSFVLLVNTEVEG